MKVIKMAGDHVTHSSLIEFGNLRHSHSLLEILIFKYHRVKVMKYKTNFYRKNVKRNKKKNILK